MQSPPRVQPLLIPLLLTEQQQEQLRRQTGIELKALPYWSSAAAARCTFGGLTLRVWRGVFMPGPSTERMLALVRGAAARHRRPIVVDLGTGCGAVALAVAARFPRAEVYGTELSPIALRCARSNRRRLGLRNVRMLGGSLLSPLPRRLLGRVTVIGANLPYVPRRPAADELYPTGTAFGTDADGLGLIREAASAAREWLAPGGSLVLQLAAHQWPAFLPELEALGYSGAELPPPKARGAAVGRIVWSGVPD